MKKKSTSRRKFIKKLGATSLATSIPGVLAAKQEHRLLEMPEMPKKKYSANDLLRIGIIGAGGMGQGDATAAMNIGGCEIVAACDLYDGRLQSCKEKWGKDLFTTRDYREIIDRKDIDVIICGTSDHWHAQVVIDAMKTGKAVYCEKPMTQKVEDGHAVIKTARETKSVFQVGSQYVSSIVHAKSKELLEAGEIGRLNFAEALMDRHNVRGAWVYAIPLDASEKTVDWKRYTSNTTQRDFDPKRFFRWRNYTDYGTGIAGDLFVHMHFMNFFDAIRNGKPVVEDATFGLRAAGPTLAGNKSFAEKKMVEWDPVNMKIKG